MLKRIYGLLTFKNKWDVTKENNTFTEENQSLFFFNIIRVLIFFLFFSCRKIRRRFTRNKLS